MAQQTAVEWIAEKMKKLTPPGYQTEISAMLRKAKQMEKQQHQETFKQSRQAKIFEDGLPPVWESFEKYYNETYGKE